MLSILGQRGQLCDTLSRREMLTVGGLGLVGLTLPAVLAKQAVARESPQPRAGFGRAKGVILLYLQGSPSHIDLWDPKPQAPDYIRGEFKPIATNIPGIFLSEVLIGADVGLLEVGESIWSISFGSVRIGYLDELNSAALNRRPKTDDHQ